MVLARPSAVSVFLAFLAVTAFLPAVTSGAAEDDGTLSVSPSREPGVTDGDLQLIGVAPTGIEQVEFVRTSWTHGGTTGCSAGNVDRFGIDRGGDDPGTLLDENLLLDVKSATSTERRFQAEFYDPSAFGGSPPSIAAGDEIVTDVTGCVDTPDRPGWYRLESTIAGANGEVTLQSAYFYVCECDGESEARERLGAPPSASTDRTSTPAETVTQDESSDTNTPTRTPTPTPTTARPERPPSTPASDQQPASAGRSPPATPSPTAGDSWAEVVHGTPTASADGAGFGVVAAVLALFGIGVRTRRRL